MNLSGGSAPVSGDEIQKMLMGTETFKRSTVLELHGPQAALLVFLYKLGIVGVRKLSFSYAGTMIVKGGFKPPPCSIKLAVVSLSAEYIQFVPHRLADKDLKI